jgi:hypothetical protein
MTLTWEKRYPVVAAALVAAIYYYADPRLQLPPPPRDLMAVVVSVSAIAIGFLATAKAILFTIQDRTVIKYFKDSARYTILVDYLMWAIYWSFLSAGLSTLALFFDLTKLNWWAIRVGMTVWVFLAAIATLSYFRVLRIFGLILRSQA